MNSPVIGVIGFAWKYMRRYWVRLLCGVLAGFIYAMASGSFIWATKTLTGRFKTEPSTIEQTLQERSWFSDKLAALGNATAQAIDPWLPRMGRPLDWRQVVGVLLFLPILVTIRSSADYTSNYSMGWVGERVIRDLRLDIMGKLSSLSLDFFTRSSSGDLLTRINVDTQNLLRALRGAGPNLITETTTIIVVFIWLLVDDWQLTLSALVLLPLCLLPLIILGRKARKAMKASLNATVSQSSQLVEFIGGIRVIKAYNLEESELERFRKTSSDLVRAGMKGVQAKELINPIIEFISMLGLGLLLLFVFTSGRSGDELAGFLAGMLMFFLPFKKLASVHLTFEQAYVGVQRLEQILGEQPKVRQLPDAKPIKDFKSGIVFDKISFAYGEPDVVKELSLTIPRGFKLGIAGESGCGKTTLVNLLFRFYDATRGSIKIDGVDLQDLSITDLRQQLALVSQDVVLFDQTVAENIACGKGGATRAEIEDAAKAAFAHDFISRLPQGYDTRVGERGVTLSGGQRQRVAIARAFIRNAPILVLDEATTALDSKSEAEVQAAIDRLAEHRTVICVAHRLSTLAKMDRIVVLAAGQIVEGGTFNELLQKGGLFAEMAAKQGMFAPKG
jgi:ABC-type multidrug transport system fused ATPase/permease subunit